MNTSKTLPVMLAGLSPATVRVAQPHPLLPFRPISLRVAIWAFLLGVATLAPALLVIGQLPVAPLTDHQVRMIAQNFTLVILGSVIVGPLLEEMIFRGAILQLGRRHRGLAVAVGFSILLFAGIHFPKGLAVVVVAVPMAALFTWLAVRSGSLWTGFICHAAFNLTGFVCTAAFGIYDRYLVQPAGRAPVNFFGDAIPPAWLALSAVLAGAAVVMLRREFSRPVSV